MMKRSGTRSPMEVEEFGSTSASGMLESEAVVEVNPVSRSVSPAVAEAAEAPSSPLVDVSSFVARTEVDPISRGASPPSPRATLSSLFCLVDDDASF